MEKLKSMRTGNRGAVTRLLRKFEEAKENPEFDRKELSVTYENLVQKKKLLETLNEQIVDVMDAGEVATEIIETDEYSNFLDVKIRHLRDFLQVDKDASTSSNLPQSSYQILNVESPPFIPTLTSNGQETTQNNVTSAAQPQTSYASSDSNRNIAPTPVASNHRLPKLTLPKFSGNILEWQTFWESYESAVHFNPSLTNIEKFNYLKSQLEGDALNTIAGFALTNGNYMEAVNVLTERFGQTHMITEAYLQSLIEIPKPQFNLYSLRSFYDNCEAYVRGLESLGQPETSYGTLLVPIIMKKLPNEIREHLAREHGPSSWNLRDLRRSILNEIRIMETARGVNAYADSLTRPYSTPTCTFLAEAKPKYGNRNITTRPCPFCNEIHAPTSCTKIIDVKDRMAIVRRTNLCFNCLGNHHVNECKSKSVCRKCRRKHHTSLCNASQTKSTHSNTDKKPESQKTEKKVDRVDNSKPSQPVNVSLVNKYDEKEKDNTATLHSACAAHSTVLLKTAAAPVWSDDISKYSNILFDEGAQRSFVTEDLAKKLNLRTESTEIIQLASFGDNGNNVRHLGRSRILIETEKPGVKISVDVLVVPRIAVPLQNHIR